MAIHKDFSPDHDSTVVERFAQARRRPAGQAAAHRRRLRRPSSLGPAAGQSLAQGPLVGRFLERIGRGDCGWPLLRLAGLRYRRFDPLPVRRQRRDRPQADLGAGEPLRRLRACRIARPYRPDDPQRGRCRRRAGRDRGRRSQRSDGRAGPGARLSRRAAARHPRRQDRRRSRLQYDRRRQGHGQGR